MNSKLAVIGYSFKISTLGFRTFNLKPFLIFEMIKCHDHNAIIVNMSYRTVLLANCLDKRLGDQMPCWYEPNAAQMPTIDRHVELPS